MTNEDAIKILEEMPISSNVHFEEIAEAIEIAIKALRNERPRGKWKEFDLAFGRNFYYCTVCKETESLPLVRWFNFCPNCGADMREADNER